MLSKTRRTHIRKRPNKAIFDQEILYQIIDESLIAHIAIVEESGPVVIPMLAWRIDDYVHIHGANNSRLMKSLRRGEQTCLTFTLFDGWVLARSAFHHSAHYRSAVVFGKFEVVEDHHHKNTLINQFIEHIAPGRTGEIRLANQQELSATMLLRISISEASVKISHGPVNDDVEDMALPVWAGYIPYSTQVGPLKAATDLTDQIETPDYSQVYGQRWCSK